MSAVLNPPDLASALPLEDQLLVNGLHELFGAGRIGHLSQFFYLNGGGDKYRHILEENDASQQANASSPKENAYSPFAEEPKLLHDNARFISDWTEDVKRVVIIGPGPDISITAKELPLLRKMSELEEVVIYEISPKFNRESANVLRTALPNVTVRAFEEDFRFATPAQDDRSTLVISTGSLTNFEDVPLTSFPNSNVKKHLAKLREFAGANGKILWGYNSRLDATMYNKQSNHEFILYLLEKVQHERFKGIVKLNPKGFEHKSIEHQGSTLSHTWVATMDQSVVIAGKRFPVREGEGFHPFISVAIDPTRLAGLVQDKQLGVTSAQFFQGEKGSVIHCLDCHPSNG